VIAATNRDLEAAISAGSFRSDLFYSVERLPIEDTLSSERRATSLCWSNTSLIAMPRKAGKNIKRVNKRRWNCFIHHAWPGNIRELQNVIERSMILCETEIFSIDENWLPQRALLTPESKQQVELPRRLLVPREGHD